MQCAAVRMCSESIIVPPQMYLPRDNDTWESVV